MPTMYLGPSESCGIRQTALKRSLCMKCLPTPTAMGAPAGEAGCSAQQAMCACSRKVYLQMTETSLTPCPWVTSPHLVTQELDGMEEVPNPNP